MRLFLTRHGETDYNMQGRYSGSTDIPLNETGFEQAKQLAEKLRGTKFDAVVVSPMLRARQTAESVCAALGMDYVIFDEFKEINAGMFEGLTREEVQAKYPEQWKAGAFRDIDKAVHGGESIMEFCKRVDSGMNRLQKEFGGKKVLLICHGGTSRAINRFCKGLDYKDMFGFSLGNCEIAEYS